MSSKNYVSVSGISTIEQLDEIGKFCRQEKFDFPIAIGYQLSSKSINKGTQNPRQPKLEDLKKLNELTIHYNLIPAFHYYTKDNSTIIGDLEKLVSLGYAVPESSLLQLNTLPPNLKTLEKIKRISFKTIFKVPVSDKKVGGYAVWRGHETHDFHFGEVMALVGMVHERKDFIDYVMFDSSHGTNKGLNLSEESLAVRFGREIAQKIPNIGLVYAGGVGASNVIDVIKSLSKYFPYGFSIDAESKVREVVRINGATTMDELNIDLVKEYLLNVREALSKP